MRPAFDRKSRTALLWITAFMLLTSVAAVLGIVAWMHAPVAMHMEVVFEAPTGGGEIFIAGRSFGSGPVRLADEDLFALGEAELQAEDWPPPGHSYRSGSGVRNARFDYCLVPPIVVGGDFVWHARIVNAGEARRFAIRFRALDARGDALEAFMNDSATSSFGRYSSTHTLGFLRVHE